MLTSLPLSSQALVVHDCLVTFDDELRLIWNRKRSAASWLFLANRATAVIIIINAILSYATAVVGRSLHSAMLL